jgi:MFS transporter, DHA3 family, macrolide efflux protein
MSTQAPSLPAESTGSPSSHAPKAPTQPAPLSMGAVLRIVPMRRMWYAQIVSVLGDFLALFAVIEVITFNLHANPQQVTGLQIAYMLPIAVLGVISGVFVDRWPLKPTLVTSDLLRACLCLLLLTVHSLTSFYVVMACISVVSSFFSPAQGVAIRSVVPVHGLRSANALLQQAFFIMRIVGPFAAGALVGLVGARFCYWADSASFVASGCLIASVPLLGAASGNKVENIAATSTSTAGTDTRPMRKILTDMQQGASFIVHHAALLFVIVALAAAMFVMGCFGPLIAVYVRDNLHAAIRVFTIGSMLIGMGMLLGVNALNALAKHVTNTVQVYGGLLGIAGGTLLMAALPRNLSLYAGCFLIGVSCAGIIVPSQTLIQQETPQALLGRVGSTVMSCIFTAQIAGLLLSGILAQLTSVRRVFALSTAMLVILAIAGKLWMEPKPHSAVPATT